jgi:hypothetical protein
MAAEESAKSLNKAMKGLGKNFILFFSSGHYLVY